MKHHTVLHCRFLLLVLLPVCFIAVGLCCYFLVGRYHEVHNRLSDKGQLLSHHLATLSAKLITLPEGGSSETTASVLRTVLDHEIVAVQWLNSVGEVLYQWPTSFDPAQQADWVWYDSPVYSDRVVSQLPPASSLPSSAEFDVNNTHLIGHIKLAATLVWVKKQQAALLIEGTAILLGVLCVVVLLAVASVRVLTRPIAVLLSMIDSLAAGSYRVRTQFPVSGEWATVKQHLNHLAEALEHAKHLNDRYVYDLIQAKEAAQEANRAKSEFLTLMTHELRTPLNGVLGMLQLLKATALKPDQQEYTVLALQSGNHLLSLIDDILDANKIEQSGISLVTSNFNIFELLKALTDSFESSACQKGLKYSVELEKVHGWEIYADSERLRKIITHILSNAIKFTHQGEVRFTAWFSENMLPLYALHIEICDTGIGIAPTCKQKIFEIFQQEDNSFSRKFGGLGLGLNIALRLIKLMDGALEMQSEQNKGSVFHFFVPVPAHFIKDQVSSIKVEPSSNALLKNDECKNNVPKVISDNNQLETLKVLGSPRLLLVEDNPVNQIVGMKLLETLGVQVSIADNGEIAVELCRKNVYDLIFMDLQMPVMDGYQATQAIRLLSNYRFTPIVAVTANAIAEVKLECLKIGMDDFVAKPYNTETLRQILFKWYRPLNTEVVAKPSSSA